MLNEKTVFRSAFWSSISLLLGRLEIFILILIVSHSLKALGRFYLSLIIFHLILTFLSRILGSKYTPRLREAVNDPQKVPEFRELAGFLLKIYFIAGLLAIVVFYLPLLIAAHLAFKPFVPIFLILAIATPFALVANFSLTILRFLQKFKQILVIQLAFQYLFQIIFFLIFIIILRQELIVAILGHALSFMLLSLASIWLIFSEINLLGILKRIKIQNFLPSKFGLANAIFAINLMVAELIIVIFLGFPALRSYIRLAYLPLLMHLIPTTIFSMFLHVAALKAKKGESIKSMTQNITRWILVLTLPLLLIILIYPSESVYFIFRREYQANELLFVRILGIGFFIQSFSWLIGRVMIASKKVKEYVFINYFFVVTFILSTILLVPIYHLPGFAFAFLFATMGDLLLKWIIMPKHQL